MRCSALPSASQKHERFVRGAARWIAPLLLSACVSSSEHDQVVHERDSLRAILDSLKTDPAELVAVARRAIRGGKPEEAQKALARLGERRLDGVIAQEVASVKDTAAAMIARASEEAARQRAALDQARADSAQREKQRLAQALSRTYTNRDEVQDITFYYAKGTSRYVNGPSQVMLYMAKPDNGTASLYMRIRYAADEWLFVESYTFKIDGRTFDVTPVGFDAVKRDNGSEGIWEWYTMDADSELELLNSLIASKSATLRFHGKTYVKDHTVTADEKRALQVMLDAYTVMKRGT